MGLFFSTPQNACALDFDSFVLSLVLNVDANYLLITICLFVSVQLFVVPQFYITVQVNVLFTLAPIVYVFTQVYVN